MKTKEILKKLSILLEENNVTIVKSAPKNIGCHNNEICISILSDDNSFKDYIFNEDITSDKIKEIINYENTISNKN